MLGIFTKCFTFVYAALIRELTATDDLLLGRGTWKFLPSRSALSSSSLLVESTVRSGVLIPCELRAPSVLSAVPPCTLIAPVWLMLVSPKRGSGTGGAPCGRVPLIVRLG